MASFVLHFCLLALAILSFSCFSSQSPKLLTLPIGKDPKTNLFYTSVGIGTPKHNFVLVIDLGGPILWYNCNAKYNSSTYNPISCDSKRCPGDAGSGCINNTICGANILSPLAGAIFGGETGEDVLFISHSIFSGLLSGCLNTDIYATDPSLPSALNPAPLRGLPKAAKGILGLARTQLTLPTQISSSHKLPRKFALCLPSSNKKGLGNLFIGGSPAAPHRKASSLLTTPLIVNPFSTAIIFSEGDASYEYFIDVKSIKVDGQLLKFKSSLLSIDKKGNGGTKISTMDPFTVLHSSIYKPLVRDFANKATGRKIKKVKAVAPFTACFDFSTIGRTTTGVLDVPIIDLELQGGVHWTINGANSMALVNKNVACLGYVDGGKEPRTAVVIGGHQLEDNLLEFDLDSSKLSFITQATCSNIKS